MPLISICLGGRFGRELVTEALIDTGATVNLIPFELGSQLGYEWEAQTKQLRISGAFSTLNARGILLHVRIGGFASVPLVFGWCQEGAEVPLILGHMNFLEQFKFCVIRKEQRFELSMN